MPKSSNQLALARLCEILRKLPSRGPGITASDLTTYLKEEKQFEVSKRTVERDLIELSATFGIVCNDQSVPYGWHWLPGQQCDFAGIDLADAMSLVLTEDVLRKLLPASMLAVLEPRFALARSKLAVMETHRYARWADKVRHVPTTMALSRPGWTPACSRRCRRRSCRSGRWWWPTPRPATKRPATSRCIL